MRGRIWIFAALVTAALVLHLALLSAKVAQTGEDNIRERLAQSTSGLHAQLELLDARLAPRAVASTPDLVEATRAPADPAQPLARPDERALRAAASALSPEPDLLAVVSRQGAILSRRAKAAQGLDDAARLPLAKAALEGNPAPAFATFEGAVYRAAAARIPGNGAAVVVGMLVDDRFAAQLKSQVDADVTLVQGGKVLASSLPQGDGRARLLRWAAAPAPGYGVLQIRLPGIDNALSGRLPRGASRYAVRGVLMPLDSGVQAALTVPAVPYLGWLGRYQAFYALGLALFLLFSLVWGLLARPARAAVQRVTDPSATPVARSSSSASSLIGTDAGEPRAAPPPSDDVPWPASEAAEVAQNSPSGTEPLDLDVPPAANAKVPATDSVAAEHPMWSADPFTPTPAPVEKESEPSKSPPSGEEAASSAAKGDFSFAGLLDDSHRGARGKEQPRSSLAQDHPDATAPGGPEPFPGDEPTRIEGVSAALLDKLRERDEEPSRKAPAAQGWGSRVAEGRRSKPEPAAQPDPAPEANVTMQDFSMPSLTEQDPDEQHWHETYDRFKELKAQLGEPADKISFEKFAAKLKKNRADLVAKHNCKGVRFSVYEKEGKAAIKASAIR
jgi:hypothetical protein